MPAAKQDTLTDIENLMAKVKTDFASKRLIAKRLIDIYPPNSEPQKMFLNCDADIAIYGGSAGSGKSFAELLLASLHVSNPRFGAVIFRRTIKQVKDEGGIWDQSAELFPLIGATPNLSGMFWKFPSGANVQFAGIETEASKLTYQGSQICYILFDELTHFSESMFFYMMSRNRSTCGVKPRMRATTNPEPGWVKKLLAPWVDRKYPIPAKSGELRWFIRENNEIKWVPKPVDRGACTDGPNLEGCYKDGCLKCFPPEKSITFIRASIYDNRDLLKVNPEYLSNLQALHDVDRKRLLEGDWDAKPEHLMIDAFDESRHVVSWREIPPDWKRYIGADFGGINGAEVVIAEDPDNGNLIVVDEDWPGESRSFESIANKIRKMCKGTPHKGAGGNRTTEQGWRQAMRKEGIPMSEPNKKHTNPGLQYQCVNDAFFDGKLTVMENCKLTIQMLGEFCRELGDDGEVTDDFDDTRFHLLAALRYIVVTLLPPKYGASPNKQTRTVSKPATYNSSVQSGIPAKRDMVKAAIPTQYKGRFIFR